jgi:lipid II:glycine glycyltransferase (peptidoglycan interpeptide bridge formation enzyme)
MAGRTPVRPIDERFVAAISQRWFRGGPGGTVLVARHAGEPLAAALVIVYRGTAHLRTLPSSRRQRELPATHLLVWDAMRWAKTQGCTAFDLDGYNVTAAPGDPLWGVNQFKRGFAPKQQPFKTVAIHDRVFSPIIVRSAAEVRRFQGWRRRSRATGTE